MSNATSPEAAVNGTHNSEGGSTEGTGASEILFPELATISREEITRRLGDKTLTLIDVHSPEVYASGHIPGAISIPIAEMAQRAAAVLPDRNAEIAAYCSAYR